MTWLLWHAMITLLLKKSAIVNYGIELRVCRVFCRAKTSDQSRPSQTRARSAMKTRHRLYFLHSSYLVRRLSATSCIFYWQAKTLHIYNQESMQIKAWYFHIVRIEKKIFSCHYHHESFLCTTIGGLGFESYCFTCLLWIDNFIVQLIFILSC